MRTGRTHLLGFEGDTKENDTFEAFLNERANETLKLVDTPSTLVGKASNRIASIWCVGDEDWVHEHRFCELATALPFPGKRVVVSALENRATVGFDQLWCLMRNMQ